MTVYTEDRVPLRETILGATSLHRYKWSWDWVLQKKVFVENPADDPIQPILPMFETQLRTTIAEKLHEEFVENAHSIQIENIEIITQNWNYIGRSFWENIYFDIWELSGNSVTTFLTDIESESVSLALIALLSAVIPLIAYVIIAYFVTEVFNTINETVELLVDPDDPETFVCPHCGQTFETGQSLTAHILLEHPNENPFICGICGASFLTAKELQDHKAEAHPDDPPSPDLMIVAVIIAIIVFGAIGLIYLRGKK